MKELEKKSNIIKRVDNSEKRVKIRRIFVPMAVGKKFEQTIDRLAKASQTRLDVQYEFDWPICLGNNPDSNLLVCVDNSLRQSVETQYPQRIPHLSTTHKLGR